MIALDLDGTLINFGGGVPAVPNLALRVCVYHPKASPAAVKAAAEQVRRRLPDVLPSYMGPDDWHVYTSAYTRKPRGGMLSSLAPTGTYYGDSDEDEKAAAGAGWSFVRVERFTG